MIAKLECLPRVARRRGSLFAFVSSVVGAAALLAGCSDSKDSPTPVPGAGTAADAGVVDPHPVDDAGHGSSTTDGSATDAQGPDAPDASGEGGDDASVTDAGGDASASWRTDTPACDACLSANCPAEDVPFPPCSGVTGTAVDGPSAGEARSSLCQQVYACVTRAKCHVSGSATPCYCGTASGASCLNPGAANGPCKSHIEAGEESTDPAAIAQGFGNPVLGAGAAIAALQCAIDNCFDECVGTADAGHP
jgi:hypothetical protein